MTENFYNEEIQIGDFIAYPLSRGSSAALKMGVVTEVNGSKVQCLFLDNIKKTWISAPYYLIPIPLDIVDSKFPQLKHVTEFKALESELQSRLSPLGFRRKPEITGAIDGQIRCYAVEYHGPSHFVYCHWDTESMDEVVEKIIGELIHG